MRVPDFVEKKLKFDVTGSAFAGRGEVAMQEGRIGAANFLLVMASLGLLALVLRQFQIESGAFIRLAWFTFAGFAVHAWLPLPWRLPFFLLLSMAGIVLVLGVTIAAWVIALGLALIGICHLPLSFRARGALLLATGALLLAMRGTWIPSLPPEAIWPILGSMFMFRLIVYFYDLRHDKAPVSAVRTLSYFFMLPNVCFPLFPVVDYKAFRRNYYDDDAYRIYQVGLDWMSRGVIQLILYRFVYHYLTLAPSEVLGPGDFVRYVVSNFLLYLRISGQFHLIIGMLYLFGFRLPETHHKWLLASSFTDFWRRINIYWKDFMLKVFYYPAYFQLRRFGATRAMILSTLFVFLMTWALHAYQWFWLRGTLLLVWQDVLFWAILGILLVVNALWEARHGRERSLVKSSRSWRSLGALAMATFATFCFISLLWSFWTSESVSAWLSLWNAFGRAFTADIGAFTGLLLATVLTASTGCGPTAGGEPPKRVGRKKCRWHPAVLTLLSLFVLLVAGIERVHTQFGATAATVINGLRSARLNRLDDAKLERGYYEQLLRVDRFNSQLWEVYTKKPVTWLDVENAGLLRFTDGFLDQELKPSIVISTSFGTISINRWGMRDQDYELKPAPGTYRIALLGTSTVMGWGVGDGETFEALIENRLNRERPHPLIEKYEILNFGVPGHDPPHQLVMLERALEFGPQAIINVATGREGTRSALLIAQIASQGGTTPYQPLNDVARKAGIKTGMGETDANRLILPHREEILTWMFRHMVEQSRAARAVPVLVFLPQVREDTWQEETPVILSIAEKAGFVVVNLDDVYERHDINAIMLAEWDNHPNARGHQLIAQRLYNELMDRQDVVFGSKQP